MSQIQPPTAPAIGTSAPTTGAASTTPRAATSSSSPQPGGALDKNAFLKLMMIQLKDQNPLDPSDPTQYVAELAQFSTLEQTTNLAESSSATASEQNTVASLALLGHTVTYTDANGNTVSGLVQKVNFTSSGPTLTVAGIDGISPSSVTEVS